MARQVFDSLDLVRHIYSFGPEHREKMEEVTNSLRNPTEQDFGIDRIFVPRGVDRRDVFQYFKDARCRCCTRHSHNKTRPVIYRHMLCFAPAYIHHIRQDPLQHHQDQLDCGCLCRQRSRLIIKEILTYGN